MKIKLLLTLSSLILLGYFILLQYAISPAISFVIGVVSTTLLLNFPIHKLNITTFKKNKTTLYVGNLPYKANEMDVLTLFSQHGKVLKVKLMKDKRTGKRRGFGFIITSNLHAQTIIDALNNFEYLGRKIKVCIAKENITHPNETT